MKKQRLISKWAMWLGRSPDELDIIRSTRMVGLQLGTILLLAAAPAYLLFDGVIRNPARWNSDHLKVPIEEAEWTVRVERPTKEPIEAPPRQPGPTELLRSDPSLSLVFQQPGPKVMWLWATLNPEKLARMIDDRATVLLLGYFPVQPRVWLDGIEVQANDPLSLIPNLFTLRESRLREPRPLQITVRLEVEQGARRPDTFYKNRAGFITSPAAGLLISRIHFEAETRPLILISVNALLTLIFIILWISFPKNQEYWYLALFTLLLTFGEVMLINSVYLKFTARTVYAIDFVNEVYLGGFGMLLGLAYARTSLRVLKYAFPSIILSPLLVVPFVEGSGGFQTLSKFSDSWIVPPLFLIGSGACLLQAAHLFAHRHESSFQALGRRMWRLIFFATILLAMMVLYFIAFSELASEQYVYYQRYLHIGLVLLVGILFILDYRNQELLLEKSFVSKWHRQAQGKQSTLPDAVSGVLLKFDMKNSTALSKEFGSYGHLTDQWYHRMTEVLWKHRGEVLFEEGDLIAAFFDGSQGVSPLKEAYEATLDLHGEQKKLQVMLGLKADIAFRASIVRGSLGLVWKQTGPMRKAGYSGDVLVDSTRILDLEKKLFGKDSKTRLVLEDTEARELLSLLPEAEARFVLKGQTVEDTDARSRVIWACEI